MLKKARTSAFICAIAAALAFWPVLNAKFVWDDEIVQFFQMPSIRTAADAFFPPQGLPQWSKAYYRPLVTLTYLAEGRLNDLLFPGHHNPGRAMIPHAASLLAHALAAALVALLARRLLRNGEAAGWGALAAGLLFALHPAHSETVGTVAGRSDSMAALFLLGGLLLALRGRDRRGPAALAAGALCFLAAFLSKEVALSGLALLPLCLRLAPPPDPGPEGPRPYSLRVPVAVLSLSALPYLALRLGADTGVTNGPLAGVSQILARLPRAVAYYAAELFYPWPISPYLPDLPGPGLTAVVLALLALAVFAALAGKRRGNALPLLCLLWFAASLAPSLAVVTGTISGTMIAQRYLYLPSVAFALLFGAGAAWAVRKRKAAALAVTALLLAFLAVASWRSTGIWQSNHALWSELAENPRFARHALPWQNLASDHLKHGELDEAERLFGKALASEAPPDDQSYALIHVGLGSIWSERANRSLQANDVRGALRQLEEAERAYGEAFARNAADWTFPSNLGRARLQRVVLLRAATKAVDWELLARARQDLQLALRMSPGNPDVAGLLKLCNDIYAGR